MNLFFIVFAIGSALAALQKHIFGLFGGATKTAFPDPNEDPFYKVPSSIASYHPGQVISSRKVTTHIDNSFYSKSFQILYRTQNTAQQPDATVATLWWPKEPVYPTKVLSFHAFTDSAQLNCNPSWAFLNVTGSQNILTTTVDAPFYIEWALRKGYYVVAPDYLGSASAFNAGYQEGYAVLDGLRATLEFNKLNKDSSIVMFGYSGGAHATVWAANLAWKYAPDLNIIGTAHGGTPVDTRSIYDFLMGSVWSGIAGAGLSGLAKAYPEFDKYLDSILTEEGRKHLNQVNSPNVCLMQIVFGFPYKDFSAETILKTIPLEDELPKRILQRESLLEHVTLEEVNIPKFPTFQYHAQLDEIVPRKSHEEFIQQQCEKGAKIQYQTLPLQDHLTTVILGIPLAIRALSQLFDGTLDTTHCGKSNEEEVIIDPDSVQVDEIMGSLAAARLRKFNGRDTPLGRFEW